MTNNWKAMLARKWGAVQLMDRRAFLIPFYPRAKWEVDISKKEFKRPWLRGPVLECCQLGRPDGNGQGSKTGEAGC